MINYVFYTHHTALLIENTDYAALYTQPDIGCERNQLAS
jgi:hypothetical protein